MNEQRLVLGIDGGGSKTAARLAAVDASGAIVALAEARSGPSNLQAVGAVEGRANLDSVVDRVLAEGGVDPASIDSAVLALAGSGRDDVQALIADWAARRALARDLAVVSDLDPVLSLAADSGARLAVIVGTGSVAGGVNAEGKRTVTGGWGFWFGDEGSGFDLGRRALAAVAGASDGTGPPTSLVDALVGYTGAQKPREILARLEARGDVRREIAACAEPLIELAATGDEVARAIVERGARDAARLIHAVAAGLGMTRGAALGAAGGVLTGSSLYRNAVLEQLEALGTVPASVCTVPEPVAGCVQMAARRLSQRESVA